MKMVFTLLGALVMPVTAVPSLADDLPPFLADGQKYVTDMKACSAAEGESEGLELTAKGMYGYEFGCTFVQFHPIRYEGSEDVNQYLAIAACGDDSGISRGDTIVISDNGDGSLRVTSQNEYVVQLSKGDDGDTQGNWIVEREFTKCPN